MYTAIAQTRNINIEASSLLLDTTSTEKRSYQYNKLSQPLYLYEDFDDLLGFITGPCFRAAGTK